MPGNLVQRIDADALGALGPVRADGEAVGLVAQALHEVKHGVARLEHHRPVMSWPVEMLAASVAIGTLGDADQHHVVDGQFAQHLLGHTELAAAAIDQHDIRPVGNSSMTASSASLASPFASARSMPNAKASAPRSCGDGGRGCSMREAEAYVTPEARSACAGGDRDLLQRARAGSRIDSPARLRLAVALIRVGGWGNRGLRFVQRQPPEAPRQHLAHHGVVVARASGPPT